METLSNQLTFNEIDNIQSICCLLGLSFPDSALDFQKAMLTLAHLSAVVRDYVLKGIEVPAFIVDLIDTLSGIVYLERENQK